MPPSGNDDDGITRPFSVTILNCGPNPRTVTRLPSPFERSIETPVIRCKDSARLVSGNLPISSAEIASTTPEASRFMRVDSLILERIPVTWMTSTDFSSALTSAAKLGATALTPNITDKLVAIFVFLKLV